MKFYSQILFCVLVLQACVINVDIESVSKSNKIISSPEWLESYYDFFTRDGGCWIADNSQYQSAQESAEAYGNDWVYAIGKNGKKGSLYGWENGTRTPDLWEFRIFWNANSGEVTTMQFGHSGMVATGTLVEIAPDVYSQVQTFSYPDGRTWKDKHIIEIEDNQYLTTSFDWESDDWVEGRRYVWERCN